MQWATHAHQPEPGPLCSSGHSVRRNGTSTFALPDLRSRIPLHQGQGNGLSSYASDRRSAQKPFSSPRPRCRATLIKHMPVTQRRHRRTRPGSCQATHPEDTLRRSDGTVHERRHDRSHRWESAVRQPPAPSRPELLHRPSQAYFHRATNSQSMRGLGAAPRGVTNDVTGSRSVVPSELLAKSVVNHRHGAMRNTTLASASALVAAR